MAPGSKFGRGSSLMQQRRLGRTDMRVSLLGLGTVKLGRNQGVRYAAPFDLPSDGDARRLLDAARSLGVNLLDTAPAYGSSEARLGRLLAGRRQDWTLVTKAGESFDGKRSRFDFTPEAIGQSIRRSCQRLCTDHIDLLLLHSNGEREAAMAQGESLACLMQCKQQGLIRAAGVSVKTPTGARAAAAAGADAVMLTCDPERSEDLGLIQELAAAGCGVLVKKALDGGRQRPERLAPIAAQPGVSSIVVGTLNPRHLKENADVLTALPVSAPVHDVQLRTHESAT